MIIRLKSTHPPEHDKFHVFDPLATFSLFLKLFFNYSDDLSIAWRPLSGGRFIECQSFSCY